MPSIPTMEKIFGEGFSEDNPRLKVLYEFFVDEIKDGNVNLKKDASLDKMEFLRRMGRRINRLGRKNFKGLEVAVQTLRSYSMRLPSVEDHFFVRLGAELVNFFDDGMLTLRTLRLFSFLLLCF